MVKIFRRPLPILAAALAISCALTAFWILKLEWTLPWLRLFDRPDSLPLDALMVQNNTLPRMAMALLAGGSTAMATMLMQQLMRNPLASDSTLAVSSGAQAALVAATVFAPSFLAYGTSAVAFAGAAAALGVVLRLSARRALQPLSVVLAGLVVSLYLGSLTGIVMLFFSEETRGVMQWGSGSLVQDSWRDTLGLLWRIAVAAILTAFLIKPLNIMSLGDTQAESAGIPVKKIRLLSLAVAAFLSAGVVGFVGMMGFCRIGGGDAGAANGRTHAVHAPDLFLHRRRTAFDADGQRPDAAETLPRHRSARRRCNCPRRRAAFVVADGESTSASFVSDDLRYFNRRAACPAPLAFSAAYRRRRIGIGVYGRTL